MQLENKSLLVVGASSGIGLALATELAKKNQVYGLARRAANKIEKKLGMSLAFNYKQVDVTLDDDLSKVIMEWKNQGVKFDGVIYSAGVAYSIDHKEFKFELIKKTHQVNFLGFVKILDLIWSDLLYSKSALIAGVSAQINHRPLPNGQAYSSSKAAMSVFLEGLRMDLADKKNIQVCDIQPGLVSTPMAHEFFGEHGKMLSVDKAKDLIITAIEEDKSMISFPLVHSILSQTVQLLPFSAYNIVMKLELDRLKKKKIKDIP